MKFSYSVIRKLVPAAGDKKEVADTLLLKSFETKEGTSDILEVDIPSNRYADGASHLGVAREYAAVSGKKVKEPDSKRVFLGNRKTVGGLTIKIENQNLCPRYGAAYFEISKKGSTPAWMKKALTTCGLRPIYPIVDILNYVMLEVGQPLHAFDADKLKEGIFVRNAKKGEKITTIDNQKFELDKDILVIADKESTQAIAGIKGGKRAEIGGRTKRIIVEAANFDFVSVYKTSRKLNLVTDASVRFAHGMSPYSVEKGLERTRFLLEEIVGAKFVEAIDVYPRKQNKEIIGFNIDRFNSITGVSLGKNEIVGHLKKLGFKVMPPKNKSDDFIVEVPPLRLDVTLFEDVVEEVIRMHGIDSLKPIAPVISMSRAEEVDSLILKDRVRHTLVAAGFTEIYSYSFAEEGTKNSYELENPIADNKRFMRQDLSRGLKDSIEGNSRFFEDIRIFEIGDVFDRERGERAFLGIAAKGNSGDPFLELKGSVEKLLRKLGVIDLIFVPAGVDLEIRVDDKAVGVIEISGKNTAIAEVDLSALVGIIEGEYEYRDIPKYPAVMRDISIELQSSAKVGDILNAIEDAKAEHVRDVDLVDYFDPKKLTFRIVFQSMDRTLKDKEVNDEFRKIAKFLESKFKLKIR